MWEDKVEDVVEKCKTELPVLKEVKSKDVVTDQNKLVNILIEGDNYHALSVLNYTHNKKLENILELVNDAWKYFPHAVLNGLSPIERLLEY